MANFNNSDMIGNIGSENQETFVFCANITREFALNKDLLTLVLDLKFLQQWGKVVQDVRFELSSEAQETFETILTQTNERNKEVILNFVLNNYTAFTNFYFDLIKNNKNYLTQRTCLKILQGLVEDSNNSKLLVEFISSVDTLKLIIHLLSDENKGIRQEAVSFLELMIEKLGQSTNPDIRALLIKNKVNLIQYVKEIETATKEETTHKEYIIHQIQELK